MTRSAIVQGRRVTPTLSRGQYSPHVDKIKIDGKVVEFIGQSSRKIYDFDDDTVIKVEIAGDQNEHEWEMYGTLQSEYPSLLPYVAKVWGYCEMETALGTVSFLLQERLSGDSPDERTWEGLSETVGLALFGDQSDEEYPSEVGDDSRHQWKWTRDGKSVKCHDFAYWLDF